MVEHSALTSKGVTLFVPVGVQVGDVAASATRTLKIDDRASIQGNAGGPATLTQVGPTSGGSTDIGPDGVATSLWSAGQATLRDRAHVTTTLFANAPLVQGNGVQIGGPSTIAPGTVRPRAVAWSVQLPSALASSVDVAPSSSQTLAPARFSSIYVRSQGTLTLTAGTFFVDSLSLDADGKILIDDSSGSVTIYVLSALLDHGTLTGKSTAAPNVLLVYLGTAPLIVDSPFTGALVAPSAAVTFRPPQVGTTPSIVRGIFAQDVEVGAGVIMEHRTSSALLNAIAGTGDAASLTPIVEGIASIGATTYAVFSYQSTASQNVHLPYGPQNLLSTPGGSIASPSPPPPEWFTPGTKRGALVFPLTSTSLTWMLGLRTVTASTASLHLTVQTQPQGTGVVVGGTFVALQDNPTFDFQGSVVPTVDTGTTTIGVTPVSFNVTGDGAAAVSVPLWVPPGRAGMQPDLSLEYNSRAGDGFLGLGWSLRGLSQITRCPKTRARNGRTGPITMNTRVPLTSRDDDDSFCLDGELLVLEPNQITTYRTQHDRFVRVFASRRTIQQSNTVFLSQPDSFEVRTKDGRILTYGGGDATMATAPTPFPDFVDNQRYAWSLRQVRDRAGNTMTFHYHNDISTCVQQYVSQIDYTGSSTDGTNASLKSVIFIPESREDSRSGFVAGFCWARNVRFREVQLWGPRPELASGGTTAPKALLKAYRLTYQGPPTNRRPLLATVTECDGASVCKPPLRFDYDPGATDFEELSLNMTPGGDEESIKVGDVDADGTDDLMYWTRESPTSGHWRITYQLSTATTGAAVPFGTPVSPTLKLIDGTIIQSTTFPLDIDVDFGPSPGLTPPPVLPLDFNMDGAIDLAVQYRGTWRVFLNGGANPQGGGAQEFVETFGTSVSDLNSRPYFADLDGDGRVDLIQVVRNPGLNTGTWDIRLAKGQVFSPLGISPSFQINTDYRIVAGRFLNSSATQLLTAVQNFPTPGFLSVTETAAFQTTAAVVVTPIPDPQPWVADVNGDGLSDVITLGNGVDPVLGTANPQTYLSLGNGAFQAGPQASFPLGISFKSNVQAFDYDQDGVSDLLVMDTSTVEQRTPHSGATNPDKATPGLFFHSDGTGGFDSQAFVATVGNTASIAPKHILDFDGDGLPDLLGPAYHGLPAYPPMTPFRHRGNKANMLTGLTDSLSRRTAITYKPSTRVAKAASSPADATCGPPTYCVRSGVWYVSDVQTDNGLDAAKTQAIHDTYAYNGARADIGGRGWLGVSARTVARNRVDFPESYMTTTTTYNNKARQGTVQLGAVYDFPFTGLASTDTTTHFAVSLGSDSNIFTRTMSYAIVTGSVGLGQVYSVAPVGSTELDEDTSTGGPQPFVVKRSSDSPTPWTYDSHGNPQHTDIRDFLANGETTLTTTDATYLQDEGQWLVSQPTSRTVKSATAHGIAQRAWTFTPDPATGLLKHVTYQAGIPDEQLDVDYVRNPHGLPKTITRAISTGENRPTSLDYDDFDGTFPRTVTNARGQMVQAFVHPGFGVEVATQDPNDLRVTRTVDGLGRLRSERGPDGHGGQIHYEPTTAPLGSYQVRATLDAGSETTVTQDDWDREILRTVRDFVGTGLNRVSTTYDPNQVLRPSRVTIPTSSSDTASAPATTYLYDSLGSLVQWTLPEGAIYHRTYTGTQISFGGPTGRGGTTFHDGRGRIYSSSSFTPDLGASHPIFATYTHGPFGLLSSVRDSKGNTTTVGYDASGRRTTLDEPDTGHSSFAWNGFGDLIQDTDSKNDVRTYVPDALGRVRQEITPDGITTYDWDTASKGIGLLGNTTSPDGVDCTYGFDSFGRPASQNWTLRTGNVGADGTYAIGLGYDSLGRPSSLTYPSVAGQAPLTITNSYAPNGDLATLLRGAAALWTVNGRDEAGRVSRETAANGVLTVHDFTQATGLLHEVKSTRGSQTLRDLVYGYDEARDLRQRTIDGQVELFGYDSLDRLTSWERGTATTNSATVFGYDDIGNMLARQETTFTNHVPTGVILNQTTFVPGDGTTRGPHQIASSSLGQFAYDPRGDQTGAPGRTTGFTSFGLPRTITSGSTSTSFGYDAAHARVLKRAGTTMTVTLGGLFERRITGTQTTDAFYVGAEGRPLAQILWTESAIGVTEQVQYLHEDHVGTVEAVTSSGGQILARQKFEPFGARIGSPSSDLRLGFDGLEQDDDLGLVNMNGRIYDPRQARFLSADPIVGNPFLVQDLSRYSYVRNSPLNYRDPSGFCPSDTCGAGSAEAQGGPSGQGQGAPPTVDSYSYWSGDYTLVIVGLMTPTTYNGPPQYEGYWPTGAPPPWWNGSMGPNVSPGSSDDGSSRGPQTSPTVSGPGSGPQGVSLAAIAGGFMGMVPGAHYVQQSEAAWRQGRYGLSVVLYAAALSDAALAVFTFGTTSVVVGETKAGTQAIEALVARGLPKAGGGAELGNLAPSVQRRIQAFANKFGVNVSVVGSRAEGTAEAVSDFDFVITGANSNMRRQAERLLPRGGGGGSILAGGNESGIDILTGPLDESLPHITFFPE